MTSVETLMQAEIERLREQNASQSVHIIAQGGEIEGLREEVAEVLAQNIKCVFAVNEYNTAIKNLVAERDALRSARIAYANEFPLNADGEPDVGNIHANIRAMKERIRELEEELDNTQEQLHHTIQSQKYWFKAACDAGWVSDQA